MASIDEQIVMLKGTVFGGSDEGIKAYSIRLPLDLTAHVEAITEVSGKSRNIIAIELLKLGVSCFIQHLDNEERSEIGDAYHRIKQELVIEMMEDK